jgi:hypothetical protein
MNNHQKSVSNKSGQAQCGPEGTLVRICRDLPAFARISHGANCADYQSAIQRIANPRHDGAGPEAGAPERLAGTANPTRYGQNFYWGVGQPMSNPPWQIVRMIETKLHCHSGKRALPKTVCIGPLRHWPCGGNGPAGAGVQVIPGFGKEKSIPELTKNDLSLMID